MKNRPASKRRLDESLEWIKTHPNAMNHEVPATLRETWILDESEDGLTSALPFTVFVFGFARTRVVAGAGSRVEISATEILERFRSWQMKLALSELNGRSELLSAPLPLFTFPTDEQVHVLPKV